MVELRRPHTGFFASVREPHRCEWCIKLVRKEGVHCVHTLGLRLGHTDAGRSRIGDVFGGVADFQGPEPGSSPTSGTCFPCSGACGPLNVYKSPFMVPCGGSFLLVADALAAPSLGSDSGIAAHSFMAGSARNCMTCCGLGSSPHGHPCRRPELFGNSRHNLDDALEHRVGPGEPIEFGNDRGCRRPGTKHTGHISRPRRRHPASFQVLAWNFRVNSVPVETRDWNRTPDPARGAVRPCRCAR
jgi:hypothetical protein